MKKAKRLYIYFSGRNLLVAIYNNIEYEINNKNQQLFIYKNKEYIGLFNLSDYKMEVEE